MILARRCSFGDVSDCVPDLCREVSDGPSGVVYVSYMAVVACVTLELSDSGWVAGLG